MLVLTRRVNESILIGSTIQVRVLETGKNRVRLGLSAPPEVSVHRKEVHERIRNGEEASHAGTM
jgi:carbon storage regulator